MALISVYKSHMSITREMVINCRSKKKLDAAGLDSLPFVNSKSVMGILLFILQNTVFLCNKPGTCF